MTGSRDNDTPAQSQSERDKTVAGNEGGSAESRSGEMPVERNSKPPLEKQKKNNKIAELIKSGIKLYADLATKI